MKVEVKESLARFEFLKFGDAFRYETQVYIKIEPILGAHNVYTAINLGTGVGSMFQPAHMVDTLQEVTLKANNINRT
jgi:hypothetical protein